MNKLLQYAPSIILLVIIISIWESVTATGFINSVILPSPIDVGWAFIQNASIIAPHMYQTILETVIGFILAIVLGVVVAFAVDFSGTIKKAVYPLIIISQTIPMIALAPLLLFWFGFGLMPKVIMVILYCFFPITISSVDGLQITDKQMLLLLKSMNATYWQTMKYVRIPNALPQFFTGVKIAATYSVTGAIIGEYVGGYQGLGIYMQEMVNSHAIAQVFAAIAITSMVSLILFWITIVIERICTPWQFRQK